MTLFSAISDRLLGRSWRRAEPRSRAMRRSSNAALALDPAAIFTPDPALIDSYSNFDENDTANIRRLNEKNLFYKDIPYSQYLGEWQFHPGRIGGFLTAGRLSPRLVATARRVQDYFVELPNGGLALYYPRSIRTARLQVNEPIYSGIAQGQLLAGFTRLIRDGVKADADGDWHRIAAAIAKSMTFPFEKGGVCVDGKVILETPNFRACPEAILNGWIDALIHLNDYLQFVPDKDMETFYGRNIEALIEMLPAFDDQRAALSRYSNLCPYTFRVHFAAVRNASPSRVMIDYVPVTAGYSSFAIADLWHPGAELRKCIYENKIENNKSSSMDLALSVSSLYELQIRVAADCARITFDPGTFNETSTVPQRTLRTRSLPPASSFDGQFTTFVVNAAEQDLIAGCPTNFMKYGQNFYHIYHVVALYELALTTPDPAHKKVLTDFAAHWMDYTRSPKHHHLTGRVSFSEPDSFVKKIARFRAVPNTYGFEELRAKATAGQSGARSP